MNRKSCLIVAGIGGALVFSLLVLSIIFWNGFVYRRTLGGPVAVVTGEVPKHGFLGVEFGERTAAPLTIHRVLEGSGAADAGLQPGDVILALDTVENPDLAAMQSALRDTSPGQELSLKIGRGSKERHVRVRLISFADVIVRREPERSGQPSP
jgi:S1-C subfamily serine protease